MTDCIVFNHHCLPFTTLDTADNAITNFLKICIKSHNMGFATILVDVTVDRDWFRLQLSAGYFWQDWHEKNIRGENRDIIRAFRSLATRQPFFSSEDVKNGAELFDVTFDGDSSLSAVRAAAWHEAPLISLPTRCPWMKSPLQVTVDTLDEAGNILSQQLNILNFYSLEIFESEAIKLCQLKHSLINSGKELIDKQRQLFPNIVFCDQASQQLNIWSGSKTVLDQVKESLSSLNLFCDKWIDGVYDSYHHEFLREVGLNHKVSGESATVTQTPRLKELREFWLPEGRKKYFENHIKLSSGYRLHFFPDNRTKLIYIGYIGPHLKLL